ncbi:MAG: hypothetical protein WC565_09380 [Parcubacteria group bacterium]
MTILRVFPRRTSFTPDDALAFVGDPPLWRPEADVVHVSCTFTWDVPEAERLAAAWQQYYPVVRLGGPALDGPLDEFVPGRYVRNGVTFTSHGCNNHCPWCLVPSREGALREIAAFAPGHIVQDNNLLQCSREHQSRVFAMLRGKPQAATFSGGIDARLVDSWFASQVRTIRVKRLFLACDTDNALDALRSAVEHLAFLGRNKLFCYVLIGRESLSQAEARLRAVWDAGCIPFAQLYQPSDRFIGYDREWRNWARAWSRPALIRTRMKAEAMQ